VPVVGLSILAPQARGVVSALHGYRALDRLGHDRRFYRLPDTGSQQRSAAITGRGDLPSRGVTAAKAPKTLDDAHAAVAWTLVGIHALWIRRKRTLDDKGLYPARCELSLSHPRVAVSPQNAPKPLSDVIVVGR
jgi:hypothetical protein